MLWQAPLRLQMQQVSHETYMISCAKGVPEIKTHTPLRFQERQQFRSGSSTPRDVARALTEEEIEAASRLYPDRP